MQEMNQKLSSLAEERAVLEGMVKAAIEMLYKTSLDSNQAHAIATMAKELNHPDVAEAQLLAESSNETYDAALKLQNTIQEELTRVIKEESLLKKELAQKEQDRKNLERYSGHLKENTTFLGAMYNHYNGAAELEMGILGESGFGPDRFVSIKNKESLDGFISTLTEISDKMGEYAKNDSSKAFWNQ